MKELESVADTRLKAAALDAPGKLTAVEIAEQVGVSTRTVFNWRHSNAEYQAEVRRLQDEWRWRARNRGIADQDERLRDLNDRHRRLRAVIQQRARDPQMKDVPGGRTGLLTVKWKLITRMDNSVDPPVKVTEPLPEYEVDTGLLAEMRAIEVNTAIEMGQWKTKTEHSETKTMDATPEAVALAKLMTPAQLRDLDERLKALEAGPPPDTNSETET